MNNEQNFLESDSIASLFDNASRKAGELGELNAEPMMRVLDHAYVVGRGVAEVLRMHRLNWIRGDLYADREGGKAMEPPLSDGHMGALLELARVASDLVVDEIEHIADWTNQHSVPARSERGVARSGSDSRRASAVVEEAIG
ncbi:hypothetical protein LMG29739_03134 [Paraburkholderia solisilvae]|uniref:Uncharacterized protein n=1 Tax=Paraburkholderia solisilvae TaxID=624376 RepID=A0A6J5DZA1_9BURK|nr:hypothetical protein LMG29739_03134 [Paraburkholderia solisilvae]